MKFVVAVVFYFTSEISKWKLVAIWIRTHANYRHRFTEVRTTLKEKEDGQFCGIDLFTQAPVKTEDAQSTSTTVPALTMCAHAWSRYNTQKMPHWNRLQLS